MNTLLSRLGLDNTLSSLSPRDRVALLVLGAFLTCVLIWLLVVAPVIDWRAEADSRFSRAEADLAWMRANADRVSSAASPTGPRLDSQALLSHIASSAREADLTLSRYQPEGDGAVSVELQQQEFNRVIGWLRSLSQQHGVVISSLSLTRQQNAGIVSGRIRVRA